MDRPLHEIVLCCQTHGVLNNTHMTCCHDRALLVVRSLKRDLRRGQNRKTSSTISQENQQIFTELQSIFTGKVSTSWNQKLKLPLSRKDNHVFFFSPLGGPSVNIWNMTYLRSGDFFFFCKKSTFALDTSTRFHLKFFRLLSKYRLPGKLHFIILH